MEFIIGLIIGTLMAHSLYLMVDQVKREGFKVFLKDLGMTLAIFFVVTLIIRGIKSLFL